MIPVCRQRKPHLSTKVPPEIFVRRDYVPTFDVSLCGPLVTTPWRCMLRASGVEQQPGVRSMLAIEFELARVVYATHLTGDPPALPAHMRGRAVEGWYGAMRRIH